MHTEAHRTKASLAVREERVVLGHNELRVIFPNSPLAVRDALLSTLNGLQHLQLTEDEASTVELVLAEVMNNIVEHAYSESHEGMIELRVSHSKDGLRCVAFDDGKPMPGEVCPSARMAEPDLSAQFQAEGGFGWFLIRTLAEDLAYVREGTRNRLSFSLDVGRSVRTS